MPWLLTILLSAMAGSLWLDVPFVAQSKDGCGSAAIWMVMQYWKAPNTPPVEQIQKTVFSPAARGVFASDMQKHLEAHGFRTFIISGTWDDLRKDLAAGRPLIVCLESNAKGTLLHYVIVAGFDDESGTVLINDPADRKLRVMDRGDFDRRWKSTENWTLLAIPTFPAVAGDADSSTIPHRSDAEPHPPDRNLELASEAFRREDYGVALKFARRAEEARPGDILTGQLLGTLYVLSDNLSAALKYWNRDNQPHIREFLIDPSPPVNAVAMDRAMMFSRGETLRLDQFEETRRRLDAARIFSHYSFDLDPAAGDQYDLRMRGQSRVTSYLSWFGGLPYQTVQPSFANIGARPIDFDSLLRWDRFRRRAFADFSAPAGPNPAVRYEVSADVRDESWNLDDSIFQLQRAELASRLEVSAGPHWSWTSGVSLADRRIGDGRDLNGMSLKYEGSATYDILDLPERRLRWTGTADVQAARFISSDSRFGKIQVSSSIQWFPERTGSDYSTAISVRSGTIAGSAPLDEEFVVGLDRDSDLRLRAHPATIGGRLGAAPVGADYFLVNSDVQKNVHRFELINVALAPFLDVARVSQWYTDSGVELRLSVGSMFNFVISAGCDLKTGRIAGFAEAR